MPPGSSPKRQSEILSRRLPFALGVEIIRGCRVQNRFTRHTHTSYIIGMVEAGTRLISVGGETVAIAAGQLFLLNPGQAHVCRSVGSAGHAYTVISVDPATMQQAAETEAEDALPAFRCIHYTDTDLALRFRRCLLHLDAPVTDLEKQEKLLSFLHHLAGQCADLPDRDDQEDSWHGPAIARVCAFIDEHLAENLSLDQLAGIARLSPGYFQRIFVRLMGISAHEHLAQQRVRRARELLLRGEGIAEVALATGFFDQSHFSKVFQRSIGMSPGRYVRLNCPAEDE